MTEMTAIERAYELARSGRYRSIDAIRKRLRQEQYHFTALQGKVLSKQLRALIIEAQREPSETSPGGKLNGSNDK